MAHMYSNIKISRRGFGDISQLTNWILDSGATCHMTPEISDFILGSLAEADKYIELQMGVMSQQKKRRSSNKSM